MSATTSDTAIAHDDLVVRIAARAFDPQIFTVYTNTQRALQRAVQGQYPHLVAVGKVDQRVEIVGMVETAESLHDLDAAARIGAYASRPPLRRMTMSRMGRGTAS